MPPRYGGGAFLSPADVCTGGDQVSKYWGIIIQAAHEARGGICKEAWPL